MTDRGEYRSIRTVIVQGPDFKRMSPNAKLVWFYIKLQLGPTGIGVFNAAKHVLSEQTGLSPRKVESLLVELDRHPEFFRREDSVFWVVGGLKNDPGMSCKNANHVKSVVAAIAALPRLAIVSDFKKDHPDWFAGEGASTPPTTIGIAEPRDSHSDAPAITEDGRRKTETEDTDRRLKTEDGEEASPPRVVLPREVFTFMARFYESTGGESERRRYRDVLSQFYSVLDPMHPGVKIRGGARVKARSVEHLIDTLEIVSKNPPPNRDHAILWVLNKLLDPPRGPTVTEKKKREEEAERQLEERYNTAARKAGAAWSHDHPEEYQKILAQVEATFKGQSGGFAKIARDAQLIQLTSKAAGFPSFEKWDEQRKAS